MKLLIQVYNPSHGITKDRIAIWVEKIPSSKKLSMIYIHKFGDGNWFCNQHLSINKSPSPSILDYFKQYEDNN